ncbi:MAG: hypothetical protein N2V78_05860 [Methanophagales archaeon]|nr:hypothetical protein [Methanophagales archaeon]
MGFKINAFTGGLEIDYSQLKELVEDISNAAKSLANKISDARKRKQIVEFHTYRGLLVSNRRLAAILAGLYYRDDFKIMDYKIPLLYRDEWIPPTPIDLREVRLEWLFHKEFTFDKSIFAEEDISPFGERRYSSLQLELVENIRLYNDPTYRLMKVENKENCHMLRFGLDTYFNYMDTCELLAYEFCKEVVKSMETDVEFSADSIKDRFKLSLRSQIDPFDFSNRSAAAGINTILIVLDNNQTSKFYLHERSATEVAEGINTISVVPSGTFQPRHKRDAYHSQDFDLYTNLLREFAEELLGVGEFRNLTAKLTDIFEIEILKEIDYFVRKGLIKVYYLGISLDCLTTKPEILTALVLEREIIDTFLRKDFADCFEGENFEIEFSIGQLKSFKEDERIMPAGAACLWLVEKNFKLFRDIER